MSRTVLLVIFSLIVISMSKPQCRKDSESGVVHIHFVDQTTIESGLNNFLFRGGNPDDQNDTLFDYDGLKTGLINASKAAGIVLPSSFYIIDINFLNLFPTWVGEEEHVQAEFNFFNANPDKGNFIFWETLGSWDNATSPSLTGNPLRDYLVSTFESWQSDQLVSHTEWMRKLLYTKWPLPAVIYGHCDCGCDRTGERFGSYYMKYLNMSWENTNELNTQIAGRPMGCENYLAMQWYCLWLRQEEDYTNLNCESWFPCTLFNTTSTVAIL